MSGLLASLKNRLSFETIEYNSLSGSGLNHKFFSRGFIKLIIGSIVFIISILYFISSQGFQINPDISYDGSLDGISKSSSLTHVLDYLQETFQINDKQIITKTHTGIEYEQPYRLLDFDRNHLKYIYPEVIDSIYSSIDHDEIDWSKYAYVFYATSTLHLCNSLMLFKELKGYGTRAEFVLLLNQDLIDPSIYPHETKILKNAMDELNIKVVAVPVLKSEEDENSIWASSFTKLLVFNQIQYKRIIYIDNDAILTRGNLDELFFIPQCKIATPSAYWIIDERFQNETIRDKYPADKYEFQPMTVEQRNRTVQHVIDKTINPFSNHEGYVKFNHANDTIHKNWAKLDQKNFETNIYNNLPNYYQFDEFHLTNILMVITPSAELYERIKEGFMNKLPDEFDMDIIQRLFSPHNNIQAQQLSRNIEPDPGFKYRVNEIPEFLILPHQVYGTLTLELNRMVDHRAFESDPHDQFWAISDDFSTALKGKTPAYYELNQLSTTPGDVIGQRLKYLHFSDAPIPKPWYEQLPDMHYMTWRARCPQDAAFGEDQIVKPFTVIDDCSAGKYWVAAHAKFKKFRKDVCGLDLIQTKGDSYHDTIY
ncbi:hypothetical protein WICMUC_001245 [Wickerhamomyces mucosus]|uniref:Glycosyltransferase family 8 protein n=1 Tax=Wickerhamomyces mucosus TaxID=1378264 RepID=A0A9P8PWW5_9ASCO|nr:hypothetical protein WICMUC_001245 [Wickerhamomyces mucosus]